MREESEDSLMRQLIGSTEGFPFRDLTFHSNRNGFSVGLYSSFVITSRIDSYLIVMERRFTIAMWS